MSATTPALFAAAAGVGFGHAILPDHWVPLAVLGRSRRYRLARVARLSALAAVAHVLLSIVLGGVLIGIGLQFRSTITGAQDTIIGCLLVATGIGFAALELTGHGHTHDHAHPGDHGHTHDHAHPGDHVDTHVHATTHHGAEHRSDASGHDAELGADATDRHPDHRHDTATRHADRHDPAGHRERDARAEPRTLGLAAVMVPFGAAASPDLTILPVFLAATTAGAFTAIGCVVIFAAVTIGTIVGLTLGATKGGYQVRGDWLERWGNAVTALVLVVIGALVLVGVI